MAATLQNVFRAARAKSIYTGSHHISAKAPEIVIVSRRGQKDTPDMPNRLCIPTGSVCAPSIYSLR